MREPTIDSAVAYAVALLSHYGFELRGYTPQELINLWLRDYPANWIRLGVIEALYQGRYKAVSVEQIMAVWVRRGQPIYRFTHEFERLISRKLPQSLTTPLYATEKDLSQEHSQLPLTPRYPDTINEHSILAADALDQGAIVQQEAPPPAMMSREELSEIPVESDDQFPEPLFNSGANPTYDANWSRCEVNKQPIHQFTPPADSSGFYLKLKSVVQQQDSTPANVVIPVIDERESEPPQPITDKN